MGSLEREIDDPVGIFQTSKRQNYDIELVAKFYVNIELFTDKNLYARRHMTHIRVKFSSKNVRFRVVSEKV